MKKILIVVVIFVLSLLTFLFPLDLVRAQFFLAFDSFDSEVSYALASPDLMSRVRGRILLDVERNGEAWYLEPMQNKRFYLGRPDDAFAVMKELGVGIASSNLGKIPVGYYKMSGTDSDGDGLVDLLETALNTSPYKTDTDGDGYSDYQEILNNYSPILGSGQKLPIDSSFANQQKGGIFLQVEQHGEAWYINPNDNKRYYLGRPADAFALMRTFGLGITSGNLDSIPAGTLSLNPPDQPALSQSNLTVANTCSTANELELARLINLYRQSKNLHSLPISKSLSYVAKIHIDDLIVNKPYLGDCNQHSWSQSNVWTGYCIKDGEINTLGHIKGQELNTGYNSDIYEIVNSYWQGTDEYTRLPAQNVSMAAHLTAWQNSHGHNIMIINQDPWNRVRWEVMGVAVKNNFAVVWFGTENDLAGTALVCQ